MASADFAAQIRAGLQPIDSIAIKMAAGYNVLTPKAWQALEKDERFELVKAKRAVFMSNGVSVPAREALSWLGDQLWEADSS